MANELSLSAVVSFSVGGVALGKTQSATQDKAASTYLQGVVSAGASPAALTLASAKYVLLKNVGANSIYLDANGTATTSADGRFGTLPSGGLALIPLLSGVTLYYSSSAGTSDMEYLIMT